jgi:hypothetical protein
MSGYLSECLVRNTSGLNAGGEFDDNRLTFQLPTGVGSVVSQETFLKVSIGFPSTPSFSLQIKK